MRALDPLLLARLQSGATTLATCWKIVRRDGAVFRFTDHDRALSFGGETFEPEIGADGAAIEESADLGVDNSEIEGILSAPGLDADALMSGRFDGAAVEIWRVDWQDPEARALVKRGAIGEVRRKGRRFYAEIRGLSQALDETRGRVYQRQCDAALGDQRCGVDLDAPAFRAEGAVASVRDEQRFLATGLAGFAADFFAHGRLDWTSGANAGTAGVVKLHAGAEIALWLPPAAPVLAGDGFVLRAGCDKAFSTCRDKYSNAINFRGFHLMPGNDVVIQIADPKGRNDGGRR